MFWESFSSLEEKRAKCLYDVVEMNAFLSNAFFHFNASSYQFKVEGEEIETKNVAVLNTNFDGNLIKKTVFSSYHSNLVGIKVFF